MLDINLNEAQSRIRERSKQLQLKQLLSQQSKDKAEQIRKSVEAHFSEYQEQTIVKAEDKGIPLRQLVSYDLDLAFSSEVEWNKFLAIYLKVVSEIEAYLDREVPL